MDSNPQLQECAELTPHKRNGLILVPIIILAIAVIIFVGMNLGHYKQLKEGEPVGNSANVAGPDNR
ncbi:hypothetical protein HNP52_002934 [Sphingomonas kyeonggiensis]|uniref:Uncharacterized protein n=1 Tax=Sphingomonas kyeonggiensis TaxID=1268553 RepID=A0A7W7K2H2_9SPHN|nr:hypothetical protein [Sphingomonas kyeonggiensis]MBB4839842.1 hypothetical protein [Sphingomonas kyeonggiensis]